MTSSLTYFTKKNSVVNPGDFKYFLKIYCDFAHKSVLNNSLNTISGLSTTVCIVWASHYDGEIFTFLFQVDVEVYMSHNKCLFKCSIKLTAYNLLIITLPCCEQTVN